MAALQEEKHAFEDYFQPSTDPGGLLYTAKLGDAGEGTQEEIEVWVTKGAKEDWVQHWDEEELAELSYNPLSWEDVPVLKGGGTASCGSAGRAAAAAAGSTSTSGGLLPSQDPGLWRALLTATDWGRVPGLIDALPPVPAVGAHSPLNQNVLRAFEATPLVKVRCVLVAKVRSTGDAPSLHRSTLQTF